MPRERVNAEQTLLPTSERRVLRLFSGPADGQILGPATRHPGDRDPPVNPESGNPVVIGTLTVGLADAASAIERYDFASAFSTSIANTARAACWTSTQSSRSAASSAWSRRRSIRRCNRSLVMASVMIAGVERIDWRSDWRSNPQGSGSIGSADTRETLAGVRGSRTHPGLRRSPTTVLKTADTTGHHPLPGQHPRFDSRRPELVVRRAWGRLTADLTATQRGGHWTDTAAEAHRPVVRGHGDGGGGLSRLSTKVSDPTPA